MKESFVGKFKMEKPKRFRAIVIMIYFTSALLVTNINGQEDRYDSFRTEIARITNAKYRIGPFSIFPSITFNLGYDNNIFRSDNPEFMISDYIARISFPINVYLRSNNWLILSFVERPNYVYYYKTKGLRSLNNSIASQIRLLLINRFVISGGVSSSRIRYRVTDEFDTPLYVHQKGFNGSIFFDPGGRLSLGFSGSIAEIRHDDVNASQKLDRRVKGNTLSIHFRLSAGSQFFLRGSYSQHSFLTSAFPSRDNDSYQINSGISFPLFGSLRGTLSFGYSKLIPKDELRPDYSGIIGNTALQWSVKRFRVRISYLRNTSFSLGNSLFFVTERVGSGVSFFLTQSIRLGYDFYYGAAKYPSPISSDLSDGMNNGTSRRDIYRRHSARIIFRLIRNTGIGIEASFWERDSSFVQYNRKNSFVYIYLTSAFNL